MKVTGKVTKICEKQTGQTKKGDTWEKQVFTLTTDDEYDNLYAFDAFGEKGMEIMNNIREGSTVTVEFNVRTNEWNGPKGLTYFTSLSPWKVETESIGQPVQPPITTKEEAVFADQSGESIVDESDDLPF